MFRCWPARPAPSPPPTPPPVCQGRHKAVPCAVVRHIARGSTAAGRTQVQQPRRPAIGCRRQDGLAAGRTCQLPSCDMCVPSCLRPGLRRHSLQPDRRRRQRRRQLPPLRQRPAQHGCPASGQPASSHAIGAVARQTDRQTGRCCRHRCYCCSPALLYASPILTCTVCALSVPTKRRYSSTPPPMTTMMSEMMQASATQPVTVTVLATSVA